MTQKRKHAVLFVLLIFSASLFALASLFWPSTVKNRKDFSALSPEAQKRINHHLTMTNHGTELMEAKMKAQNSYLAPRIGDSIWPRGREKRLDLGVDHSADTNESYVLEDLKRNRQNFSATDPNRIIRGQMSDQEKQRRYVQAYREEYARQFIENARNNGYIVQLDDDFVVMSVTPIPNFKSRNPSLFDASSQVQAH